MATVTVAAVQAAYVLMDRDATLAKVEELLEDPAVRAADLVVFPEVFVPGTPIWIDSRPIWDGDEQWFALLADQAVVVPSEATDRLAAAAREASVYLVIGVEERETEREHHLQHPAVLRSGRHSARQAPQAHADRLRTHRLGHGRRLHPADVRHAVRPHRWAHLLGELHAARAVLPLRPGRRRLGGADAGPWRWLGRDHAAHRPRGPLLRRRGEPRPAGRPDPGRLP